MLTSLVLIAAFLLSINNCADWTSPDTRHAVTLGLGGIGFGWRPDGWDAAAERYPAKPGWSIASFGGDPGLDWWIECSVTRSWEGVAIPLWMPFVVIVVPTGLLWYRDRHRTRRAWERFTDWIRPRSRRKLYFKTLAGALAVHLFAVIPACMGTVTLSGFLFPPMFDGSWSGVQNASVWLTVVAVRGTPLWVVLWAWLWVRWRNRLLMAYQGHHCLECGYDLTGNVSGRCSECGAEVPERLRVAAGERPVESS